MEDNLEYMVRLSQMKECLKGKLLRPAVGHDLLFTIVPKELKTKPYSGVI